MRATSLQAPSKHRPFFQGPVFSEDLLEFSWSRKKKTSSGSSFMMLKYNQKTVITKVIHWFHGLHVFVHLTKNGKLNLDFLGFPNTSCQWKMEFSGWDPVVNVVGRCVMFKIIGKKWFSHLIPKKAFKYKTAVRRSNTNEFINKLFGQWVFNDHAGCCCCCFWFAETRLVQKITSKSIFFQNRNMFHDSWQVFFPKICITMDHYWAITTWQKPIFIVFVTARDRVNRNGRIPESERPLKPNSPLKFLMK